MTNISLSGSAVKYVCYYRVSTLKQGQSGLGLDAQKAALTRYIAAEPGKIIGEFTETESGKKAHNRPQLNSALELCKKEKAVLLIAKLDRLARNVHFVSGLLESTVTFVAVDQPTKDRFMLHVQAAFAEEEARRISLRTKEALAAAKRRGVLVGDTGRALAKKYKLQAKVQARSYESAVLKAFGEGVASTAALRDWLNLNGVVSPGGRQWHLPNTHRLIKRLGLSFQRRESRAA